MQNNIYNAQFRENVFIVGKTGCRKTHFVQKLGLNNFFDKIIKAEWVSSISLSKSLLSNLNNNLEILISLRICFSYYNT